MPGIHVRPPAVEGRALPGHWEWRLPTDQCLPGHEERLKQPKGSVH